jgi:iron-sulfur cluster repair protein YtfE (RIC family)
MPTYDLVDPTLTVNEILQRFPTAIVTLSSYGIDTCCRGNQSLARAAASAHVDPHRILAEITAKSASALPTLATPAHACDCGCSNPTGDVG